MDVIGFYEVFLLLGVLSLWWKPEKKSRIDIPLLLWGITVALGVCTGRATFGGVGALLLLSALLYRQERKFSWLYFFLISAMAILLAAHKLPFFHNLLVIDQVVLKPGTMPFTMYINGDKIFAGGLLLYFLIPRNTLSAWNFWQRSFFLAVGGSACLLFVPAVLSGILAFSPGFPEFSWLWAINNLFFVSMAEEAFFRGFLQTQFVRFCDDKGWQRPWGIAITALLFGFAHYAGGFAYSFWGTCAGLLYGWLYEKYGQIEAAIAGHFMLNALHFFLFSYPLLLH